VNIADDSATSGLSALNFERSQRQRRDYAKAWGIAPGRKQKMVLVADERHLARAGQVKRSKQSTKAAANDDYAFLFVRHVFVDLIREAAEVEYHAGKRVSDLRRLSVDEVSTVRGSGWVPTLPIANRQSLHPSATADGTDFIATARPLLQAASLAIHTDH
jgi:hypothetical protein